jgi:hypothetical protein
MRRKNFYVAEVDVYLIGVYLSNESIKSAKAWKAENSSLPLSDALMSTVKGQNKNENTANVVITLKFVRDVAKTSIVEVIYILLFNVFQNKNIKVINRLLMTHLKDVI